MQQKKRGSTWAFVSYIATSIIVVIDFPLALKDGRHLEAISQQPPGQLSSTAARSGQPADSSADPELVGRERPG